MTSAQYQWFYHDSWVPDRMYGGWRRTWSEKRYEQYGDALSAHWTLRTLTDPSGGVTRMFRWNGDKWIYMG